MISTNIDKKWAAPGTFGRQQQAEEKVFGLLCYLFGHEDTPETVSPCLEEALVWLIEHKSVNRFLVGDQGGFDAMALHTLQRLGRVYPHITCHRIPTAEPPQPSSPRRKATVPRGHLLSWRKEWMAGQADYLFAYVCHDGDDAHALYQYAKREGKKLLNLAEIL